MMPNSLTVLLVKATIILASALLVTRALSRWSAGSRHAVWLVTLATLLFMPAVALLAPLRIPVLPATAAIEAGASTAAAVVVPPPIARDVASPSTTSALSPQPQQLARAQATWMRAPASVIDVTVAIWGAVALLIVLAMGAAWLAVRRIVRRGQPLLGRDWLDPLHELADRLGIPVLPRLICSNEVKMPFACGVVRSTIVLPGDCDQWSADRRRAVLLHELAHVRRHDLVGHTLGRIACAVYWFHPLVWTAAKRLRVESERACDDVALVHGAGAAEYAEHLLDIVTSVRRDRTPIMALAMARRSEFEGRILAILNPDCRRMEPSRRRLIGMSATIGLLAFAIGAAAPVRRSAPPVTGEARAGDSAALSHQPEHEPHAPGFAAPAKRVLSLLVARETLTLGSAPAAERPRTSTTSDSILMSGVALAQSVMPVENDTEPATQRAVLLAKVLKSDTSAKIRRVAAWGLARFADQSVAAGALVAALRADRSAEVRETAAWALAEGARGSEVTSALSTALRGDADSGVRATAAWSLGNLGDARASDALIAALSDTNGKVRTRAAWALGNVHPDEAPRPLVQLLDDTDPRVRELAAWALYNIADPATLPSLEKAFRSEKNQEVQMADLRAIAAMGDKSVAAIRELVESPDERIRSMAVRALVGRSVVGPWPWPWPEPRPFP